MRRYYVGDKIHLQHDLWVHEPVLLQKLKHEAQVGDRMVLFDGAEVHKLYKIDELKDDEIHLLYVTDFDQVAPKRNVYLLWVLQASDQNTEILHRGARAGVSHFIPLVSNEHKPHSFDHVQALETIVEAIERGDRSDMPTLREPMHSIKAVEQLAEKVQLFRWQKAKAEELSKLAKDVGILVAPDGGWSEAEEMFFNQHHVISVSLDDSAESLAGQCELLVAKLLQ